MHNFRQNFVLVRDLCHSRRGIFVNLNKSYVDKNAANAVALRSSGCVYLNGCASCLFAGNPTWNRWPLRGIDSECIPKTFRNHSSTTMLGPSVLWRHVTSLSEAASAQWNEVYCRKLVCYRSLVSRRSLPNLGTGCCMLSESGMDITCFISEIAARRPAISSGRWFELI